MAVMEGRYGPYVKWDKVFATIPKDTDPQAVTFEMAVELVNDKAAKGGKKPAKKAAAKPATKAAPKASAKKPAAKKPAAKKPAAKKPAAKAAE